MTCTGCEHHVQQALQHNAGATDATADFRRNEVVFTIAGEPDQKSLKDVVKSSGDVSGDIEVVPIAGHEPGELVEYRMPIEGMTCSDCEGM